MLLRRQLVIVVLVLTGVITPLFAVAAESIATPFISGGLIDFGRPGVATDPSPYTGKPQILTDRHRSAEAGQARFASRIGDTTSGKTALRQAAANDPMPGSMYVLGFSLIGFAVVARRRRVATACE